MTLSLNDISRDFEAESTEGKIPAKIGALARERTEDCRALLPNRRSRA
jgi:hypothetical protein